MTRDRLPQGSYGGQAAVVKLYHARHEDAEDAFLHELEVYEALSKWVRGLG